MDAEVRPYAPDAWVDAKKTQVGYELSFTKYFYKHVTLRSMEDIVADWLKETTAIDKGELDIDSIF